MPDLIDEIKEDIKDEKFEELWKKYGNHIIGAIIVVVLSTGGSVWWKSSNIATQEKNGSQIYKAYLGEEQNNGEESIEIYSNLIEEEGYGDVYLSGLRKAALLLENNDVLGANEVYKGIVSSKKAPIEVREFAEILYLQNSISEKKAEDITRLKKIAEGEGVFKYSAKEMLAFIEYEAGNYMGAKTIFEGLKEDVYTPMRMRDRSVEMIKTIEAKTDA